MADDRLAWLREVQDLIARMPEDMRKSILESCVPNGKPPLNHELNVFEESRRYEFPVACLRCGAVHALERERQFYQQGYRDGLAGLRPILSVADEESDRG